MVHQTASSSRFHSSPRVVGYGQRRVEGNNRELRSVPTFQAGSPAPGARASSIGHLHALVGGRTQIGPMAMGTTERPDIRPHSPALYEIRVAGALDQSWSALMQGMTVTVDSAVSPCDLASPGSSRSGRPGRLSQYALRPQLHHMSAGGDVPIFEDYLAVEPSRESGGFVIRCLLVRSGPFSVVEFAPDLHRTRRKTRKPGLVDRIRPAILGFPSGEGGIRTPGTVCTAQRFLRPPHSSALPPPREACPRHPASQASLPPPRSMVHSLRCVPPPWISREADALADASRFVLASRGL